MKRYDFFVAGRWRNYAAIMQVVHMLRAHGKTVYCFIENSYAGEDVELYRDETVERSMATLESFDVKHPLIQKIFQTDMAAQKVSDALLLVLPAGLAAHMEVGVSYGMGKPCYAVGTPDKTETLYCMFSQIFASNDELDAWLASTSSTDFAQTG